MKTATCADCDIGWSGPNAWNLGLDHENQMCHVVWYDENDETEAVEKQFQSQMGGML
jgi:hypothetical protein